MPHIGLTNLELSDDDLAKWIEGSDVLDFDNIHMEYGVGENGALLAGKPELDLAQAQYHLDKQDTRDWNMNNLNSSSSSEPLSRDIVSPLTDLSTPGSKDAQFAFKPEGPAQNIHNKDNAIVEPATNERPAKRTNSDKPPKSMAGAPFVTPTPINTHLPTAGPGFHTLYGSPGSFPPAFFWNGNITTGMFDGQMMNNGLIPALPVNPVAWQMNSPMQQGQYLQSQGGTNMHVYSPYHSPLTQGVAETTNRSTTGPANQSYLPAAVNFPQSDNFSQPLPKRKASGQEAAPRRVSPNSGRRTHSDTNQVVQAASTVKPASQPFPSPAAWAAGRLFDKPATLLQHYEDAHALAPRPASELTPMECLGVHDYALRTAFAKGAQRAQEIIAEALTKDLCAQRIFGCNVQWPTGHSRSMVEESVRVYLKQKVKFGSNDDPATVAGMIRDSCQNSHPGLYPSPKDVPLSKTPQKRKAQALQGDPKAATQPSSAKSKANSQERNQASDKKRKTSKEKADTNRYILTGKVIPRRFSEVVHYAYTCSDGQNRILDEESFKIALERTEKKHEQEGTVFELKMVENMATGTQGDDAFVPSTTSGKKRKAAQSTGNEPVKKKPAAIIMPQRSGGDPSTKTSQPKLILPSATDAGQEVDTATLATSKTPLKTGQKADDQLVSKADQDSKRINELTRIDKGLPESIILDFMYPKASSPYEVVREAARKGLGDQSELLLDPFFRDPVLKAFDAKHLALMEVSQDAMPEWDAQARNKAKRDRKKAARTEELVAARANRVAAVEVENVADEASRHNVTTQVSLEAVLEQAQADAENSCDNALL